MIQSVKGLIVLATLVATLSLGFLACAPSEYRLSAICSPNDGGIIRPSSGSYERGIEFNVTATAAPGYRFDHWEGSVSGESPTIHLVMDGDKNLAAYFAKVSKLSVSCSPSAGGSVSPGSGAYDEGEELTLVATPAQYYRFDGWGGDASGSSDHVTITMDFDKRIVASFTKLTYTLEVRVEGSGGTVEPTSGTFEAGTYVDVTATSEFGYRFDHWGGSASGNYYELSLLLDGNKTVTAYFTKVHYLFLTSQPTEGGGISANGGNFDCGMFDAGTEVTLLAMPVFPYAFDHWSGTNNDAVNPTTVTMDSDRSVVAHFT